MDARQKIKHHYIKNNFKFIFFSILFLNGPVGVPTTYAAADAPKAQDQKSDANFVSVQDGILKRRIDFWLKIYTQYSSKEGLIHDAKYPEIVFEKIELSESATDFNMPAKKRGKLAQKKVDRIKDFYRNSLLSIHKKLRNHEELVPTEKRIVELYKDISEPNKFYNAAHSKRIRLQRGQRDHFMQGLFYSGRYINTMERIFKERGVPVQITRLPFVESSFNLKARSKVGASGIWQFMRSTGKFYLKINDTIDERNDPIRATEAAAELLKLNYESLGSWPLAITAYNHGRKGLMRAVRKIGSNNLEDIIDNYRSRSFGFASSNFFCEFMAAYEAEKNSEKYFGKIQRDQPIKYSEFVMTDFIKASDIATYTRIPLDTLTELNPGLTDVVYQGKRLVPSGYVLRIPVESKDAFLARYNEIPAKKKFLTQKGPAYEIRLASSTSDSKRRRPGGRKN